MSVYFHLTWRLGWVENIQNHNLYWALSNNGSLIYIEYESKEQKFKFQISSYRGRYLETLTNVKIQVARKYTIWVFKIWVCLTNKSTKTHTNFVIMIGCTDLNSFRTFSRVDKLRSFCFVCCTVIVVQIRSFRIPTSGTFE